MSSTLLYILLLTTVNSGNYIFVNQLKSVNDAQQYCSNTYGTSLATIHDATENAQVLSLCDPAWNDPQKACSIGLHDKNTEDSWEWFDGTPFSYNNWRTGEPNNWSGEDCAIISDGWLDPKGIWADVACDGNTGNGDWRFRFVCNAPTTSNPTGPPTSKPTEQPTNNPTPSPTMQPTPTPTGNPTDPPTPAPTNNPTASPTDTPTTSTPTYSPITDNPTPSPTEQPSNNPTKSPTLYPTKSPTRFPSNNPTISPSNKPTATPTASPTPNTDSPTTVPTKSPVTPSNKLAVKDVKATPITEGAVEGAAGDDTTTTEILSVGNDEDEFEKESGSTDTNNYIYIIIGVAASFCFSVCCVALIFYVKRVKNNKQAVNELSKLPKQRSYIHTGDISPINTPMDTTNNNKNGNYNNFKFPDTEFIKAKYNKDGIEATASSIAMISMPGSPITGTMEQTQSQSHHAIVSSLSMVANIDFNANLTNLAGANNILMDDVVVDMENNDENEDVIPGNTTTAGPDDVELDNLDMTESTNEQDMNDETDEDDTGEVYDDNDDHLIGGYETIGGIKIQYDDSNNYEKNNNNMNDRISPPPPVIKEDDNDVNVDNYGSPKTYVSTFVESAVMDDIIIDLETDTIQ